MGCVDDLLEEVGEIRVAGNAAANEDAVARLGAQSMLEVGQAGFGRGVEELVVVTGGSHPLLQVAYSFGDSGAVFFRDQWMIQGQADVEDGCGHGCLLRRQSRG